jgi:O-antigen ligase
MTRHARFQFLSRPKTSFALLCVLFVVLWLAGGASRADVMAQVVMRATAWTVLIAGLLFGERPAPGVARAVWILLLAILLLVILQLIPLPPAVWQTLPGRTVFAEAATASGQEQPWRALAIVPSGAFNAVSALVVPVTVLFLTSVLSEQDRARLPGIFVALVVTSTVIGVLQFSGSGFSNPLLNDIPGQVSAIFANRNHFALFLALGCVVAPVWALSSSHGHNQRQNSRRRYWRTPVAIGLVMLFLLVILAIGSRAGLLVGAVALCASALLFWAEIKRMLRRYHPRVLFAVGAAIAILAASLILLSIAADRAAAISRIFALDPGQDMRAKALPTVVEMARLYFPIGSGFGSFDQVFRIHEPDALLNSTYLNHAHNDLLEVVLEAGLPGLLLLLAAMGWWVVASLRAWRTMRDTRDALPLLGSVMLLLIAVASIFDYPARTPMIMATMVLSAVWLCGGPVQSRPALPLARDDL